MFENGGDAGEFLVKALRVQNLDVDIVLFTSIESFNIAKKVASALDVPLNSMISRELKAPDNNKAFGAVSEQNTIWIDDDIRKEHKIGDRYVSRIKDDRLEEINESLKSIGLDHETELASKNVVLVSAGISSGIKEAASLGAAFRKGSDNRIMVSKSVYATGLQRMGLADNIISFEKSSSPLTPRELNLSKNKTAPDEIERYFKV